MPIANFTDRMILGLKPQNKLTEWWDKKIPEFGIRVSPKGKKTWFVFYRFAGKRRRMNLGRYPDVSLEEARKKAGKARADVSDGKDPVQQKKLQQAEQKREMLGMKNFAQLGKQYVDEYAKVHKRSWKEDERIINKLLAPEFGNLNVKEISRSHVRTFLRGMAAKTPTQANRTRACLSKIFNWAIDEEIIEMDSNPTSRISSPGGKEKPKERNLNDDELKAVWHALEKETSQAKDVLRLILLTGQRPGEAMGMRWDEINSNEALWTIPGARTKNQLPNVVPLSTQSLQILERHREEQEKQQKKWQKRGLKVEDSTFVFPNKRLTKHAEAPITHVRKATGRIWRALSMEPFSAHDLRRTCATRLGQMQVPGHVIARILNHKQTDITTLVYNQYEYLKEKREALESLGARIAKLASELELVAGASKAEAYRLKEASIRLTENRQKVSG
jgi:integrase